jgi:hypothetical protein
MILILLYIVNKWKETEDYAILYIIAATDYTNDMVQAITGYAQLYKG